MCVDTSNCTWGLYKHCKWYTESWPGDKTLATLDSHTHVSIAPGFLVHPLTLTSVTCPQDLLLRFHCPSSLPDMNCLFVCLFKQHEVLRRFIDALEEKDGETTPPSLRPVLRHMCALYGLWSLERQLTTLYQGQLAILLSFLVWRDRWPCCTKVIWPFCCLVCPVWVVEFGETAGHTVPRSDGHFVVFLSLERQLTTLC